MKVKATQLGFYNLKRRRPGEIFTLHDPDLFSEKWMESLDGKITKSKKKTKPEVKAEGKVEDKVAKQDDDVI